MATLGKKSALSLSITLVPRKGHNRDGAKVWERSIGYGNAPADAAFRKLNFPLIAGIRGLINLDCHGTDSP